MKTFSLTDLGSCFSGKIDIEVPNYSERIAICQSLGLGTEAKDKDLLAKAADLFGLVQKHVKSINVNVTATGEVITSLDELSHFAEGSEIINSIGRMVISGFQLSNPSK